MRALVVFESLWGDVERIARAIADVLEETMIVEVVITDSAPSDIDGFDLLVVGAPTHRQSMSRPATREEAHRVYGAPHVLNRGVREWLYDLSVPHTKATALAFSTALDEPRLPGSAAKAIRYELRSLGLDTPVKAETFRVAAFEGPLLDGELERAVAWIRSAIASDAASGASTES